MFGLSLPLPLSISRMLTKLTVMWIFFLDEIYLGDIRHALNEMNSIGEPVALILMWSNLPHARNGHHFRHKEKDNWSEKFESWDFVLFCFVFYAVGGGNCWISQLISILTRLTKNIIHVWFQTNSPSTHRSHVGHALGLTVNR